VVLRVSSKDVIAVRSFQEGTSENVDKMRWGIPHLIEMLRYDIAKSYGVTELIGRATSPIVVSTGIRELTFPVPVPKLTPDLYTSTV